MRKIIPLTFLMPGLLTIMILSGFGGGPSLAAFLAPPNPDLVTLEVLDELSRGSDDFSTMSSRLKALHATTPTKTDALFFKAFVDLFAYLQTVAMDPDPKVGKFKDLYTRFGLKNPNDRSGEGNFWNFKLEGTNHKQGVYPKGSPMLNELVAFLDGSFRVELEKLVADLKKIPANFFYLFQNVCINEKNLGYALGSDVVGSFSLDYGDIQLVVASLEILLAKIDLALSYEADNLDPNDFDPLDPVLYDPLGMIANKYTKCGTGRKLPRLAKIVQHIQNAFSAYKNAAQHILNETPQQQASGIFTIDPTKFSTPLARQTFLQEEAYFRQTWMPAVLQALGVNKGYQFTHSPEGLKLAETVTINFYRFFYDPAGVDLRGTFLRAIKDPRTSTHELGVGDLKLLTAKMATFDGVFVKKNGRTPVPGDLQTSKNFMSEYWHLVSTYPSSSPSITIDGNLGDWKRGVNCVVGATSPVIATKGADIGEILVAKDSTYLYVAINKDVRPFIVNGLGYFHVDVSDSKTSVLIYKYGNSQPNSYFSGQMPVGGFVMPTFSFTTNGVEIAIPLSNFSDSYIEMIDYYDMYSTTYRFNLDRGHLLLKR